MKGLYGWLVFFVFMVLISVCLMVVDIYTEYWYNFCFMACMFIIFLPFSIKLIQEINLKKKELVK